MPRIQVISKNKEIEQDDEINFDQDEDIFENINYKSKYQDINSNENEECQIDHDIFGNSNIAGIVEKTEGDVIAINTIVKDEYLQDQYFLELPGDFLNKIASKLQQFKHFSISESFNEISIIFNNLKIKIAYDPSRKELLISSRYDIHTNIIRESLIMFNKSEMIGQLAIDTINNVDHLILKHRTPVIKYNFQEIMSIIERIIYESIQLQKLTI